MTAVSPVHVVMCIDQGFAVPLAVSLASLDAVSSHQTVMVHVIHPGLDVALRDKVTHGLSHLDVRWIRAEDDMVAGVYHSAFLSQASLYRLLIGELLTPDIDRVLYVDADTVFADSLKALFGADLDSDCVVGATRDAQNPWSAGPLGPRWDALGLCPSSPYFNAGVMLIDLDAWRSEDIGNQCLELLRTIRPRWGDQDVLNTVLEDRWDELPRRWNVQTADFRGESLAWALWREEIEGATNTPGIVHYTDSDKPWLALSAHPQADRWYDWLDRTSWANWRPVPAKQPRWELWARAAVGRVRSRRHDLLTRLPA